MRMVRLVSVLVRVGFLAALVLGLLGVAAVWMPSSGLWTVVHVAAGLVFTLPLLWQAARGGGGQPFFRWAAVLALLGMAVAVLSATGTLVLSPWLHLALMVAALGLFEGGTGAVRRAKGVGG
jgi:hypothetical protein